jgi:hypothetical protein
MAAPYILLGHIPRNDDKNCFLGKSNIGGIMVLWPLVPTVHWFITFHTPSSYNLVYNVGISASRIFQILHASRGNLESTLETLS